jgi:hypothetical protein
MRAFLVRERTEQVPWRRIKGLIVVHRHGINDAKESVMDDNQCPKCGSSDGRKLCRQGHEAQLAKEAAYQNALVSRTPTRTTARSDPRS